MNLRKLIKRNLLASGWYVKRLANVPPGINWAWDVKRLIKEPLQPIMFDVGANIGQTTLFMREEFPDATIHAFEPVPDTFRQLQRNTASVDRVFAHEIGLGEVENTLEFSYIPGATTNSLVSRRFDSHPSAHHAHAHIVTIDRFCAANGVEEIHLLKSDTEGHDLHVLKGARDCLARGAIGIVLIEVTFDPGNPMQTQFQPVNDLLQAANFALCSLYEMDMLQRVGSALGTFCNALFVRRDLLPRS
jgi:FkbM family methyltransferase